MSRNLWHDTEDFRQSQAVQVVQAVPPSLPKSNAVLASSQLIDKKIHLVRPRCLSGPEQQLTNAAGLRPVPASALPPSALGRWGCLTPFASLCQVWGSES